MKNYFQFNSKILTKILLISFQQACIERMLNLTDHLRRLRVDKYEYVAMKVIVLLQSGKFASFSVKVEYFDFNVVVFLFKNRHIWSKRTRTSTWMSRESAACITNLYTGPLSGCTIKVWWTAFENTRIATNLSGTDHIQNNIKFTFKWLQLNTNQKNLYCFRLARKC